MINRRQFVGSTGLAFVAVGTSSWLVKATAAPPANFPGSGHAMAAPSDNPPDEKDKKGRVWRLKAHGNEGEYMLEVGGQMPSHHFFSGNKKRGYYSHALAFSPRYDNPGQLRKALIEAYNLELFDV